MMQVPGRRPSQTPLGRLAQTLQVAVGVVGLFAVVAAVVLFTPGRVAALQSRPAVTTTTESAPATTVPPADSTTSVPAVTVTTVPEDDGVRSLGVRVPEAAPYRVARGETLQAIAARFGTTWQELAALNRTLDPGAVGIGTVLLVPSAGDDPAPVTAAPALLSEFPERAALIPIFDRWAEQYEVPAELLKAAAWHESRWDQDLAGDDGGIGIGRRSAEVYAFVATAIVGIPLDPAIPAENIQLTAAYLGWLLAITEGDTSAALAAFAQGLSTPREIVWDAATVEYLADVLTLRPVFDPRAAGS